MSVLILSPAALPPKPAKSQQSSSAGEEGGGEADDGRVAGPLQEAEWYWGDISRYAYRVSTDKRNQLVPGGIGDWEKVVGKENLNY